MINVLIVDDHRLVRACLSRLISDMSGIQVVAQASSGEQALTMAREHRPQVVLMDILMPGMGGLEATRRLLCQESRPAVLAVSACAEAPFPAQMLKAGAQGYLTKDVDGKELETAIRRVFVGRRYVCNDVAQALACYAYEERADSPFDTLSHREMQIMMMVIGCQKVSEISGRLHLSPKTVNSYRYRIFDKLKVSSDVELVLLALKYGLLHSETQASLGQQNKPQPLSTAMA